ncbi:PilT protein domain protein [Halorhabdus utahensis DSM 12940]|uniref:PilT protein domain protein n=1 Tax=Halorhabdus utahensis (strain DSM 12940 / JCM 11049 / AX-2) TaxID=519442 RepID=C7NT30_HALUD|nr:PIN domain-containing protein [Halorhabdus utahensis]ACV12105.1 PilT protein domain protein [Halorhabdus utahensis DSM 12940]
MTFLDSSVIADMLAGDDDVVEFVESEGEPYVTSTICVFEVIEGYLGQGDADVYALRQDFGGVTAIDLTESIALEALRLQNRHYDNGNPRPVRDLLIAATARSTGDHLVVADSDFVTPVLEDEIEITNLRSDDRASSP